MRQVYPPLLPVSDAARAILRPARRNSVIALGLTRVHQCFDDIDRHSYVLDTSAEAATCVLLHGNPVCKWTETGVEGLSSEMLNLSFTLPSHYDSQWDHHREKKFSPWMYSVLKFNLAYRRRNWRDKLEFTKGLISPFVPNEDIHLLGKSNLDCTVKSIHEALNIAHTCLWYLAYEICEYQSTENLHTLFGGEWVESKGDSPDFCVQSWAFWVEHVYLDFESRLLSHG